VNEPAICCARCAQFENAPHALERELPGLSTLSSGFAAVLGDDGLCRLHERLVSASSYCAQFRCADGK